MPQEPFDESRMAKALALLDDAIGVKDRVKFSAVVAKLKEYGWTEHEEGSKKLGQACLDAPVEWMIDASLALQVRFRSSRGEETVTIRTGDDWLALRDAWNVLHAFAGSEFVDVQKRLQEGKP